MRRSRLLFSVSSEGGEQYLRVEQFRGIQPRRWRYDSAPDVDSSTSISFLKKCVYRRWRLVSKDEPCTPVTQLIPASCTAIQFQSSRVFSSRCRDAYQRSIVFLYNSYFSENSKISNLKYNLIFEWLFSSLFHSLFDRTRTRSYVIKSFVV